MNTNRVVSYAKLSGWTGRGERLTELDRVDRGRGDFESDFSISRGVGQKLCGTENAS